MLEQSTLATNRFFTVKQFAKEKGFISESGLRWLIFNADRNGFDKVIKRIGKKIVLDYCAFESWIEETNQQGGVK